MHTQRTIIKPEMIEWVRERLNLPLADFAKKMCVSPATAQNWESGKTPITMSQAKRLSSLALLPFGLLFLDEIPKRSLSLPDFRSTGNKPVNNASPELEATIFEIQEKQDWYREYLIENEVPPLDYVGSISIHTPIQEVVKKANAVLAISDIQKASCRNWEDYFNLLVTQIENAGIVFIRNGVVGNNTHRPLNVEEFRGFVMTDSYAPFIFINGADSKNAQLFTLIHEFIHVLLGESGLVDVNLDRGVHNMIEKFCNEAAAEFLVPQDKLRKYWEELQTERNSVEENIRCSSKDFMVSVLVMIIRCKKLNLIPSEKCSELWQEELRKNQHIKAKRASGGDFFSTLKYRAGRNFAKAVIAETASNNLSYRDAFRLLRVKNTEALVKLSQMVELPIL